MITAHATPEDFDRWETFAKGLDSYSLKHVMKDCAAAAAAMRGWNPNREGYYMDQMSTYGMELTRRNRNLPAAFRNR